MSVTCRITVATDFLLLIFLFLILDLSSYLAYAGWHQTLKCHIYLKRSLYPVSELSHNDKNRPSTDFGSNYHLPHKVFLIVPHSERDRVKDRGESMQLSSTTCEFHFLFICTDGCNKNFTFSYLSTNSPTRSRATERYEAVSEYGIKQTNMKYVFTLICLKWCCNAVTEI